MVPSKRKRTLAIIPARGGSKGFPRKNITALCGFPLIAHSIMCSAMTPDIDRTIVSTDSEEIATVAREHGAEVPFIRPSELAQDTSAMWPVIRHALNHIETAESALYDTVLLLDPTSPNRSPAQLKEVIDLLWRDIDTTGVVSVSEPDFHPIWHCVTRVGDKMRDFHADGYKYVRRQDLPIVYRINASIYAWKASFIRQNIDDWRSTGENAIYEMDNTSSIHIDDVKQFKLAELMIRGGLINFPWLEKNS